METVSQGGEAAAGRPHSLQDSLDGSWREVWCPVFGDAGFRERFLGHRVLLVRPRGSEAVTGREHNSPGPCSAPCHLLLAHALRSPLFWSLSLLGWQKSLDILQKGLNSKGSAVTAPSSSLRGAVGDGDAADRRRVTGRSAAGSPALTFPLGPPPPPPLGLASELPAQPAGPSAAPQHGCHGRDAGGGAGRQSFRNQFPLCCSRRARARLPPGEPRLLLPTREPAHFFGRALPPAPSLPASPTVLSLVSESRAASLGSEPGCQSLRGPEGSDGKRGWRRGAPRAPRSSSRRPRQGWARTQGFYFGTSASCWHQPL